MKKQRLVGLDLFKIIAMLAVFMFHSYGRLQANYYFLNAFAAMGNMFMTAFFMLSGYAIYYTYSDKNFASATEIKKYYLKRFIGILPLYYASSILYTVLYSTEKTVEYVLLAPVTALGLQAVFPNLSVSHYKATWFMSCIILCYLIYPFIQLLLGQVSSKTKMTLLIFIIFILLWSPFVAMHWSNENSVVDLYRNPFFRILEFFYGAIWCSLKELYCSRDISKILANKFVILLEYVAFILIVTLAFKVGLWHADSMAYSVFGLPLFTLILLSSASADFSKWDNKFVRYCTSIALAFYMAQLFVWPLTRDFIAYIGFDKSIIRITSSFVLTVLIAVLFHEIIEKPIGRLLKKKLL